MWEVVSTKPYIEIPFSLSYLCNFKYCSYYLTEVSFKICSFKKQDVLRVTQWKLR